MLPSIKNKKTIPSLHIKEAPLDGDKEIIIKRETQVDIVAIAFHIPDFKHKDQFALSAYSEILSGGKSSVLREKLINQKGLVSEVYAYNMELKDPGVFLALAICNPGVNVDKVEKEIKNILLNTKITKKALNKIKNQTRFDFITQLESSSNVSNIYGDYFAKGDITPLIEYEEKIKKFKGERNETNFNNGINCYFSKFSIGLSVYYNWNRWGNRSLLSNRGSDL